MCRGFLVIETTGNYKPGSDVDIAIKGKEITFIQLQRLPVF